MVFILGSGGEPTPSPTPTYRSLAITNGSVTFQNGETINVTETKAATTKKSTKQEERKWERLFH